MNKELTIPIYAILIGEVTLCAAVPPANGGGHSLFRVDTAVAQEPIPQVDIVRNP
jgi:hypothetical protein